MIFLRFFEELEEEEEYHEQCRQFAAEYLNIEIPLPNEKLTLNL